MSKNKLNRFEENKHFSCVMQDKVPYGEKWIGFGKWNERFGNDNAIVLELGCGKGEYSIGLSELYPNKNFIGIDIKGARLWQGAKIVDSNSIQNIYFLRTRIECIESFFERGEISEIWLPFPDPQLKKDRVKLVAPNYIQKYASILKSNGSINLKTDSQALYEYTLEQCDINNYDVFFSTEDVYLDMDSMDVDMRNKLSIQTFYEKKFLLEGKKIKCCSFRL